jgi:hypothetical protein
MKRKGLQTNFPCLKKCIPPVKHKAQKAGAAASANQAERAFYGQWQALWHGRIFRLRFFSHPRLSGSCPAFHAGLF